MKNVLKIILIIVLLLLLSVSSWSMDMNGLRDNIDDITREYLNDLGIYEISFEEIFELSPSRVLKFIFQLALGKACLLYTSPSPRD